jgi:hypothetical protein
MLATAVESQLKSTIMKPGRYLELGREYLRLGSRADTVPTLCCIGSKITSA